MFFEIDTKPKTQVIGIDPDTYEIKVRIAGGGKRHIFSPATSSDGKLFINPALRNRTAPADNKVIVLNKYGKPVKTFIIPAKGVDIAKMFVVDDYLFIGDAGGAVCMMDTRNYHIFFYETFFSGGIIAYSPCTKWKNYIFLVGGGINTLLKVNLNNPSEREIKTNYAPDSLGFYHYCIYDDRILSVCNIDILNTNTSKVRVYNLNNDQLITNFFASNYTSIPACLESGVYGVPVVIGNELLIYAKSREGEKSYARMLVFDKDNYNFLYEINLDKEMILPNLILRYARGTKLYFDTASGIYIYDHAQKRCVRHITPLEAIKLPKTEGQVFLQIDCESDSFFAYFLSDHSERK